MSSIFGQNLIIAKDVKCFMRAFAQTGAMQDKGRAIEGLVVFSVVCLGSMKGKFNIAVLVPCCDQDGY